MGNKSSQNIDKLYTKLADLSNNTKNIIAIPIDIITNNHTSERFHCKFTVSALFTENETISNILDVITQHINKQYYPINFRIFKITALNSFIPHDVFFDSGLKNIIHRKITFYKRNNIKNKGLQIEIMVNYQYNRLVEDITCKHMISNNTNNPTKCPIYYAMKEQNKCTQQNLLHLNDYNHFKTEYNEKPECKFNDHCSSYKRLEAGGNRVHDLCHIRLYKHPPRNQCIKLSHNINSLIFNKNNAENAKIYEPTVDDKKIYYNDKDGFLNALIEEIILNGYIKHLGKTQNGYNILETVDVKMECKRHKLLGFPLNRGQMLSLILYCGYDVNCDLCKNQRNGNYKKWKWFDYLLYTAIFKLSSCETGNFSVFS
eukprot:497515_1